jgi:release factor glutamine methyltransferase
MAFDGGPFGVSILMRLLQEAPDLLKPGGWLAFEVGLGQGPAMEKRLRANDRFRNIECRPDSNGQIRAISAQCG